MIQTPNRMDRPFAINGDKAVIPVSNDPLEGRFSQERGFPPITALPISQGGVAPYLEDFNGVFYALAMHIFWKQSGGMYEYDPDLDYPEKAIIVCENSYFSCKVANGPGTADGAKSPLSEPDYWQEIVFGENEIKGPGQGLSWGIAPTGKLWTQSDMPGISSTRPGDMYTNHQDDPKITVGENVQLPPSGTWLVQWMEVKSTMTEDGSYDDSKGLNIIKCVLGRAYAGGTVFTPSSPTNRIIMDAYRIL